MNSVKNFGAKVRNGMIGGLALSMMVAGCATTDQQTAGFPKVSNTVLQACAGGAVLGLLTTALTNDDADLGDYALGAAGGALAGCAVGAILDDRRKNYASTADYYDAEIARTRDLNTQVAQVNSKLTQVISENRTQLENLRSQQASATYDRDAAKALKSKAKAELNWAQQQLKNANAELEAQELVLAQAEREAAASQKSAQLRQQVASLKQTVSNLETQVASLSQVSDAVGQFTA